MPLQRSTGSGLLAVASNHIGFWRRAVVQIAPAFSIVAAVLAFGSAVPLPGVTPMGHWFGTCSGSTWYLSPPCPERTGVIVEHAALGSPSGLLVLLLLVLIGLRALTRKITSAARRV